MDVPINSKILLGALAVAFMLWAYGLQISKTMKGLSEPHPIAWFGFGLLTFVGWIVQLQKGAGAGSWVMGGTAFFCLLIAGVSQYKKRWRIADFGGWDWGALGAGICLFVFYLIAKNFSWGPVTAAALATTADLVLYVPIFRKAWLEPQKEYGPSYALNSIKFIPSLFAMTNYSVETYLYPGALIIANIGVVIYLWVRKKSLNIK